MRLNLKKIKKNKNLGFFRFKNLGKKYLITNEEGRWLFLEEKDFFNFLEGRIGKEEEIYRSLAENNFLKKEFDFEKAVENYCQKKKFLFNGPTLHILVVTLRCNNRCVYCHSSAQSMDKKELDMSIETAKKALELVFQTPSPFVAIEFQGGEPLANWPVVKFVIEEARKISKQKKKELDIRLITNLTLMNEEKYSYLIKNKVGLCTSLDGPREIHNKNRPLGKNGDSHKAVISWVRRFNKEYPKLERKGYIWRIAGITTISRFSLSKGKEIIDEYRRLGYKDIFLRPLDPFGFSEKSWQKIGYGSEEFIKFYKEVLDYIIEINKKGEKFIEKLAQVFLVKILTESDLNMMDYRSPCGAVIGQIAYNYNGDIYTCDEGRMLSMMGDESFKIGNVYENSYEDLINSPVTKSLCSASCLIGAAGCQDCVYHPYCGSCPVFNYFEQGNILGQMPSNDRCKINIAILDYIFEKMQDPKIKDIFFSWTKK